MKELKLIGSYSGGLILMSEEYGQFYVESNGFNGIGKIRGAIEHNAEIERENRELRESIESLKKEKDNIWNDRANIINKGQKEIESLKAENEKLKEEPFSDVKSLYMANLLLQQENLKLKQDIALKDAEIEFLKQTTDAPLISEAKTQTINLMNDRIMELQEEIEAHKKMKDDCDKILLAENNRFRSENNQLRKEYQQLQEVKGRVIHEQNGIIKDQAKSLSGCYPDITRLQNEVLTATNQIHEIQRDNMLLLSLVEEKEDLNRSFNRRNLDLETENEGLSHNLTTLKNRIGEISKKHVKLINQPAMPFKDLCYAYNDIVNSVYLLIEREKKEPLNPRMDAAIFSWTDRGRLAQTYNLYARKADTAKEAQLLEDFMNKVMEIVK